MKSDSDLKQDVDNELKWNPELNATDIATEATAGSVTLSGTAQNLYEKHLAELTVKCVAGVIAVANDLTVRPTDMDRISDPELARESVLAIKRVLPVSWQNIQIMVQEGRVVLEGNVEWAFLRERAAAAIRSLHGVMDLRNSIQIRPEMLDGNIKAAIEAAFERSAVVDADRISVEVNGSEVTLTGTVRSWLERDEARQAAWCAPGVTDVFDALRVRH